MLEHKGSKESHNGPRVPRPSQRVLARHSVSLIEIGRWSEKAVISGPNKRLDLPDLKGRETDKQILLRYISINQVVIRAI